MTEAELKEIEARANAATPGPWEHGDHYWTQSEETCPCVPNFGPLVGIADHGPYGRTHIHRRAAPWTFSGIRARNDAFGGTDVVIEPDGYEMSNADADLIAHSRTDIPALLAEVRRLREENAALKEAVR